MMALYYGAMHTLFKVQMGLRPGCVQCQHPVRFCFSANSCVVILDPRKQTLCGYSNTVPLTNLFEIFRGAGYEDELI